MPGSKITFPLALIVAAAIYFLTDFDPALKTGLSVLSLVAILWMTETFNITVTALLIPVLAVLTGIFSVADALKNFANPIIFLFLGGFALAAALNEQQLDRYISNHVLRIARGKLSLAAMLLFLTAAGLSMWISNTATTAMMLPLVLGLLKQLPYEENKRTYWFVLLGLAYSASIGGIGTLVGSPPNAIAAAAVGLTFLDWLKIGMPLVIVSFPLMILALWLVMRPDLNHHFEKEMHHEPLNATQWMTLGVFALTVCLWLFSAPLSKWVGVTKGFDALIAIAAILMLCMLKLVSWKSVEKSADWGVLLLFGGGLTLSAMLKETGTSLYLAQSISDLLHGAPVVVFILVVSGFVVMLTEIASNTASSALLVPIFVGIAGAMGMSEVVMAMVIAVAASCAFMLPVATPPNAIVYGSGAVPQSQMMRAGIVLNAVMTAVITGAAMLML
ncbi:Di-and tricarboxylate transporter [Marinobacterium lacunae]|uniref:Di-and tricarboxylate transporter n=1 Tax=Marinobacterium lacunae TaxID=1232683 RepID=A0A081FV58_9GAMM|nr:Di-and tricarboxylate transporter [Marinobacterium lacunae]MBR9884428.1 DASS family sodium-coupled anion symporter [Oceanospirillales bacterium]